MTKSAKKMIDAGQSSKKKVEAAFPSNKICKKKSSKGIIHGDSLSEDFGTKVEAALPSKPLNKGVEEEAINDEKMKAEESVTVPSRRFRALVGWSGVDVIELEPHFKKCGEIAGIDYVPSHRCAWIDFTNEDSLKLALDLDKTKVDNRRINVSKYKPGSGGRRTRRPPSSWLPTKPNGQPIVARLISGPRD